MNIQKNDIIPVTVTEWLGDGGGLCRVDGMAVFVSDGVPGDVCDIRILKVQKTHAYAKVETLHTPSKLRQETDCPVFPRCGGCKTRHITYAAELDMKRQTVQSALRRIGGIDFDVPPVVPSPQVDGYRNKVIYQTGYADGARSTGFYRSRSHAFVPVERCLLQSESADRAAAAFRDAITHFDLPLYDEEMREGDIRWLFYRESGEGRGQMCIVAKSAMITGLDGFAEYIAERCPFLDGILLNVNREEGNVALSGKLITLWGAELLKDTLCGFNFEVSPLSFYQVNRLQAERLYDAAVTCAGGGDSVLELYCGTGTISLCLARRAKRVVGIEYSARAISDANKNAAANGVKNVTFICGDAGEVTDRLIAEGERFDTVLVDPPRKGLSPETVGAILRIKPERLVYVSCDPATLARDLELLRDGGYDVRSVQPFDMFPRTSHVETVVLLSRKTPSDVIHVDLELDELDITAAEAKATYEEIKAYVLEQSGLKVSSLYISQVKRKHGIIERENYNKPKTEDSKQPQCPPDKEKAITDALRHFEMV